MKIHLLWKVSLKCLATHALKEKPPLLYNNSTQYKLKKINTRSQLNLPLNTHTHTACSLHGCLSTE